MTSQQQRIIYQQESLSSYCLNYKSILVCIIGLSTGAVRFDLDDHTSENRKHDLRAENKTAHVEASSERVVTSCRIVLHGKCKDQEFKGDSCHFTRFGPQKSAMRAYIY